MSNGSRRLSERTSTAAAVLVCCVFCCLGLVSKAAAQTPPTDGGNVTGWMWSRAAGWISLNCSNFGNCDTSLYGVNLEGADSGPVKLTGYAWSDILGWICFGETCAGTNPENIPTYAEWRQPPPPSNPAEQVTCTDDSVCSPIETCGDQGVCQPKGRLYGWAKVVSLGNNGWIALNCDNDVKKVCGTSNFFVVFDQGKFTLANPWPELPPDPNNYHWAWSANDDGTGLGWIDTSMVFAPWAPPSIGRVRRPEGIYEPDIESMDEGLKRMYRPSKINIIVERVWSAAKNRLECLLFTSNGTRRLALKNFSTTANYGSNVAAQYMVTQNDETSGAILQNKRWIVRGCRLTGPPNVSLPCSVDTDCPGGRVCDPITNFCRKVLAASPSRAPVYVHSNRWTLFNNNEDYYQAIKCYAGFPGQFFNNAPRCDFAGDASFSMAMSKGIQVKRNCHALPALDGSTDCPDDFYCSGISYMCKPRLHPPTRCVWENAGGALLRCSDPSFESGELCCSHQPITANSSFNAVVNGLECTYQDPDDGYYDCDCTGSGTSTALDCYPPYYQNGDLCCDVNSEVTVREPT